MEIYFQVATATLISFLISFLGLLCGEYKLYHSLLIKKPLFLFLYSLIYAFISGVITYIIIYKSFSINGINLNDSPWMVAISIGISSKSIANSNIHSFKANKKTIAIGPKIITDLFEDFFRKKIQDDLDEQLIKRIIIIEKKIKKGSRTARQMDELINRAMPTNYTKIKLTSYMQEIKSSKKPFDKVRYFANKFGDKRIAILENIIDVENDQ